jgi:hypothetical protein
VFGDEDHLASEDILARLHRIEEAPWGDHRGKPLDALGLAQRLRPYDIKPTSVRIGESTPKGYRREDLHDPWMRYLGPPPYESATSATRETDAAFGADVHVCSLELTTRSSLLERQSMSQVPGFEGVCR